MLTSATVLYHSEKVAPEVICGFEPFQPPGGGGDPDRNRQVDLGELQLQVGVSGANAAPFRRETTFFARHAAPRGG